MMISTPTIRNRGFGYFNTAGRAWTPAWDHANDQARTVKEIQLGDGSWHTFERFVSEPEAIDFLRSLTRAPAGRIAELNEQRAVLFRALQPFAEAWHKFPDLRERWKHIDNAEFKRAAQAVTRVRNAANGELDE